MVADTKTRCGRKSDEVGDAEQGSEGHRERRARDMRMGEESSGGSAVQTKAVRSPMAL